MQIDIDALSESDFDNLVLDEARKIIDGLRERSVPPAVATEAIAMALSFALSFWCEQLKSTEPLALALIDVAENTRIVMEAQLKYREAIQKGEIKTDA